MKICLLVLVLVAYVNADCGCLKCSKHLQGVDVPGPTGPVKVIFRRPKPAGCSCGCCCSCGAASEPPPDQGQVSCPNIGSPGAQYSAKVQIPLPKFPRPRLPLRNLKYRTDTILVPSPTNPAIDGAPSAVNPAALTTEDILNWLTNLQIAHQLAAAKANSADPPQLYLEKNQCTECQKCRGNLPLEISSHNTKQERPPCPCCVYQRFKKSPTPEENIFRDQNSDKVSKISQLDSSTTLSRPKRDLTKHGYNFLMNMLPQSVRAPLHHSLQGANHLQQSVPKSILKQKFDSLNMNNAPSKRANLYNQFKTQNSLPQQNNFFNQPSRGAYVRKGSNYLQQPQKAKYPFLDQDLDNTGPPFSDRRREWPKYSLPEQRETFGRAKISPKSSLLNREDPLENQKYLLSQHSPKHSILFGKTRASTSRTASAPSITIDPSLDNTYKRFLQKYGPERSQIGTPKLSERLDEKEYGDEKTLLKKLKKLNNNPFTSNLEDQATMFIQKLLKPEESTHRNKRCIENIPEVEHSRKKRTIILGSDEIDLPTHYEVEMVSVEDDSEEFPPQEFESFEEDEDDEDPIVGASPYMRKTYQSRFYPSLPSRQHRPEIVLGKSVIQEAVRKELDAYHKKVEREQKLKEMKENLHRKKQQPFGIPQNPIMALLTAPVKFLRHFHDLNKGVSPVITSLPKLVYTTKKVFRDLGKNFQRNCLDLASNVIGDFDHIHPTVIQQIVEPNGGRYRRDILEAEFKKCAEENQDASKFDKQNMNKGSNNENLKQIITESKHETFSEIKLEKLNQTNKTLREKGKKLGFASSNVILDENTPTDYSKSGNTKSPVDLVNSNEEIINQTSKTDKIPLTNKPTTAQFAPDYTLVFQNSEEKQNFRKVDKHARKKRYVVKVVDDDEIQDHVEEYLQQKLGGQYQYLNPLQGYYDKVNGFLSKLYSSHQPLCQVGDECYYQRTAPKEELYHSKYDSLESLEESYEESFEAIPKKKKIKIKKMKPRVIIDNKGRPFMEYNGYKRPLKLHGEKIGMLKKSNRRSGSSSEETDGNKIATLIARAKVDSEVVGNSRKDIIPHQIVKERISALLEEIDQLVHLNAEDYDDIFEELIKIEHVKASIEQDWKRMLIDDRVNDIGAKIGLLSKFKDLQYMKDSSVKKIVGALKQNDNEFVRCQLVNSLIRLQKLQCLISSVVEDFEQHLKMKTPFNTKKEIKYVDYITELKFVFAKTRNDLIKMLGKDRDSEGLKYMSMLQKLKKLLISADENPEKFDHAAELLWEMKNLEKLQKETINDMNKKLIRNFKVKKELKILFDLQRRFEDCNKELREFLGDMQVSGASKAGQKKDIKEVIAEVKRRHEEMLQRARGRSGNLLIKKS